MKEGPTLSTKVRKSNLVDKPKKPDLIGEGRI